MTTLTTTRRGRCAGIKDWQAQYQALQMTAREAAELIRDGDVLAFAAMANWPWELDSALAERLLKTGAFIKCCCYAIAASFFASFAFLFAALFLCRMPLLAAESIAETVSG